MTVNQFHQYQQNEQSPLTTIHSLTLKRPPDMTLEIQVMALDRHKNMAELLYWLIEQMTIEKY